VTNESSWNSCSDEAESVKGRTKQISGSSVNSLISWFRCLFSAPFFFHFPRHHHRHHHHHHHKKKTNGGETETLVPDLKISSEVKKKKKKKVRRPKPKPLGWILCQTSTLCDVIWTTTYKPLPPPFSSPISSGLWIFGRPLGSTISWLWGNCGVETKHYAWKGEIAAEQHWRNTHNDEKEKEKEAPEASLREETPGWSGLLSFWNSCLFFFQDCVTFWNPRKLRKRRKLPQRDPTVQGECRWIIFLYLFLLSSALLA